MPIPFRLEHVIEALLDGEGGEREALRALAGVRLGRVADRAKAWVAFSDIDHPRPGHCLARKPKPGRADAGEWRQRQLRCPQERPWTFVLARPARKRGRIA
jgi:hypothetical protein